MEEATEEATARKKQAEAIKGFTLLFSNGVAADAHSAGGFG